VNLKRTQTKPFSAKVTFGLEIGYTKELIEKSLIIKSIQKYQDRLIREKNITLSVSLSECSIILSGQKEPHLNLNFINYPKFPLKEKVLKYEIENLTKSLMSEFKQNRVVIEYLDETVMFENSINIDPRIKQNNNSIKKKQKQITEYKCIYCGETDDFTLLKLLVHLDMFHDNISEIDKQEIIKDFKLKNGIKPNLLKKEKVIKNIQKDDINFNDLKKNALNSLSKVNIDPKIIKLIKSKNSLLKLQNYLSSLKKEYKEILLKDGVSFKRVKTTSNNKKKSKFINYRLKVINCLVHNSNLPIEKQKHIYSIQNKNLLIEYINKNLSKEEIATLKKSKIEPFFNQTSFTKIIYNPMGNKR
jgi:hypothetical protein